MRNTGRNRPHVFQATWLILTGIPPVISKESAMRTHDSTTPHLANNRNGHCIHGTTGIMLHDLGSTTAGASPGFAAATGHGPVADLR